MANAAPRPLQLDDFTAPLETGVARDEAAQDHIAALAHFATGRTLQQRGDFAGACRHFARADRLDPVSRAARSALVACAVEGKRYGLAARYSGKDIDRNEVGEDALEVLADYWLNEGDLTKAIEFSELALRCIAERRTQAAELSDIEAVLQAKVAELNVHYALRELYSRAGKTAKAADEAASVTDVLEHPDRLGVSAASVSKLMEAEPKVVYRSLGNAFLMDARYTEAEAAFRKAYFRKADETLLNLHLARIAARRGQASEALAKLQPYLDERLTSEGVLPYQALADALKKQDKGNELLDRLEKLYQADPANLPLSYFLAAEYVKAGKLDRAEPIYVALSGREGERALALPAYQPLAEIYRKTHRPDKLLALLGKVIATTGILEVLGSEVKPLTSDAALYRSLVEAGRKKGGAALEPADYAEFLVLGTLAQDRKEYDAAAEFFELALKANATKADEVLLAWGTGALLADRAAEAGKIFQRGIDAKVMPGDNPVFHFYLAAALVADNQLDAALAAARIATERNPDSARFAERVPWILFRAKRYDEARRGYEKLLEKFSAAADSLETALVLRATRLELSGVCVALGRLDEAQERLEEVLDEYPDDLEADNDLGFLWADQNKRLDRALKMISAAVASEPDNRAYRDSLGWVYYRLGRFSEAVAELEKAVDEKQPDATILDHLGDSYAKLGKADKAQDAWRRSKAAYEKDKEPEKAREVTKKIDLLRETSGR